MPLVFKTKKDTTEAVDLVGVGLLGAEGKGGVTVELAARTMVELQERDEGNQPKLKDGVPVPLTGNALKRAAEDFAEGRGDVEVVNVREDKLAGLAAEMGVPPDRPSAVEVAEQEFRDTFDVESVNTDPQDLVEGGPDTGEPAPPAGGDE